MNVSLNRGLKLVTTDGKDAGITAHAASRRNGRRGSEFGV